MLGKPTVSRLICDEPTQSQRLAYLDECPIVPADETTIYSVLKDLVGSAEKRRMIGEVSRACAMKWWSADACAERYERVYDCVMEGRPPGEIADQYTNLLPLPSPWKNK